MYLRNGKVYDLFDDCVQVCEYCNEYYLHTKSGIRRHINSHPEKWICDCLKYFYLKKNLVKHMYSLHDIKPNEIIYKLTDERNMLASKKLAKKYKFSQHLMLPFNSA